MLRSKRQNSNQKRKVFGGLLLGLGIALLFFSGPLRPSPVSFQKTLVVPEAKETKNFPQEIRISSLKIHLSVRPAEVGEGDWPLFEEAASYLAASGGIGQIGNSVIYAHNKNHLFGPLKKITLGDQIEVEDQNQKTWHYQVEEILVVSPKEVDILSSKNYPALTLYTCSGFLDQFRFVVVSRLSDEV
jgi:LPXTG-site transpeptidase (sortase) family protein